MPTPFRQRSFWLVMAGAAVLAVATGTVMNQVLAHRRQAAIAADTRAAAQGEAYSAIAEGKADVEGGIISVAARTTGVIREVDVNEGDQVIKGQVLAKQEDDSQRLAAATAEATLQQAQAQIVQTEVQVSTARREAARLGPLTDVVAGQLVDQTRDSVSTANALLGAQRAAVSVAAAQLNEARYRLEQTVIRAPTDGRIVRRYAAPGAGASTLNVTPMFDLEPAGRRIVRAEVSEGAAPFVNVGDSVRLVPEADQSKAYSGKVLRRAAVFGARKLQSDDPSERIDERVVEVVVSAEGAPFLIGQRVLVKFLKPGA